MSYRTGNCPKCGKNIIADQMFIDPPLKGFMSEDHGCGKEYCLITFEMPDEDVEEIFFKEISDDPS